MSIDFNKITDILRVISAKNAGLPFDYLVKKWVGSYNPRAHLFNTDGTPIWFHDDEIWTRVGTCYCEWFNIPESQRFLFWVEIASLMPK
jgi:hypothetical protein